VILQITFIKVIKLLGKYKRLAQEEKIAIFVGEYYSEKRNHIWLY